MCVCVHFILYHLISFKLCWIKYCVEYLQTEVKYSSFIILIYRIDLYGRCYKRMCLNQKLFDKGINISNLEKNRRIIFLT